MGLARDVEKVYGNPPGLLPLLHFKKRIGTVLQDSPKKQKNRTKFRTSTVANENNSLETKT